MKGKVCGNCACMQIDLREDGGWGLKEVTAYTCPLNFQTTMGSMHALVIP